MNLPAASWRRRWVIYIAILVPVYFMVNALFGHHDFIWVWLGCCVVADGIAGVLQRRYWRA